MKGNKCFYALAAATSATLCHSQGDVEEVEVYPTQRYVQWELLNVAGRQFAAALEYTEDTWNSPGAADIEILSYETIALNFSGLQAAIDAFGINEPTWDCYINHYADYNWTELEIEEVQDAFVALGYDERSWEGEGAPPASEDKFWSELNAEEQEAAEFVCYFQQIWDEISLELWSLTALPTAAPIAPTSIPTFAPTTTAPTVTPGSPTEPPVTAFPTLSPTNIPTATPTSSPTDAPFAPTTEAPTTTAPTAGDELVFPKFRYVEWSNLESSTRSLAEALFYKEAEWNLPGSAAIEALSIETIQAATPQYMDPIREMGFNEKTWDCYINHYQDYTWQDLADEGVQGFYTALGWTQMSWESDASHPASEDKDWGELTAEEKKGAEGACYFEELWQEIPLPNYPDVFGPGTDDKSAAKSPKNAMKTAVLITTFAMFVDFLFL